jgi:hypothetical protein
MNNDQTRQEMDALLDDGIKSAAHFLSNRREFYPFGVALTPEGKINHVQTWGGAEHPACNEVLELLCRGLKQGLSEGTDVKIRRIPSDAPLDAISVQIEHPSASPIVCHLPYRFVGTELVFGD